MVCKIKNELYKTRPVRRQQKGSHTAAEQSDKVEAKQAKKKKAHKNNVKAKSVLLLGGS